MQAAIGLVQLDRMGEWTERRTRIARALSNACAPFAALRVPATPNHVTHAWYRFYAFVRPEALAPGWSRDRIIDAITDEGVPCFHGSASEVYLEKAFDGTGYRPAERLQAARALGETSMAFLVHPTLTDAEVEKTCDVIGRVMRRAEQGEP